MINEERLTSTFCELVQIDSPTGHEQAMAQEMVKRLTALGISAVIDTAGNVIARVEGNNESGSGEALLLNAHIDTVEPGRGIEPVIESGIIRSSSDTILGADNKVAVAAMLEAIMAVREQGVAHPPIEFVLTVSEEVANIGAIELDTTQLTARYGFTCDSGDTLGTITIASPYYNRFDIQLRGAAAHASRPEQALNVLPVLQKALAGIQLGRISENTVCNIGMVQVGHARNTVPGTLSLSGEVRSFVREELDEVTARIMEEFESAARAANVEITTDVVLENDGYLFSEDDVLAQFTAQSMQAVGVTPQMKKSSECYDANIFNGRGIQVLNIANEVQGMHTVNESITVENLTKTAEIIAQLITDFPRFAASIKQ